MNKTELLQIAKPILFNTDMVKAILDDRKTVTRRVRKIPPFHLDDCPGEKIKEYSDGAWYCGACGGDGLGYQYGKPPKSLFPPYKRGDILYVRETWSKAVENGCRGYKSGICPFNSCKNADGYCFGEYYIYKADDELPTLSKWRPSIHMPKEAARIFLRVTDVRVERLQDITEEQAVKDGINKSKTKFNDDLVIPNYLYYINFKDSRHYTTAKEAFSFLWNSIYAAPAPVKKKGIITHYESYPWEDIQETKEYKGLPWIVCGNPWVTPIEFEKGD